MKNASIHWFEWQCPVDQDGDVYTDVFGLVTCGHCIETVKKDPVMLRNIEQSERLDGVALIARERERQLEVEGWSAEHDDQHSDGELMEAAVAYALSTRPDSHVWVNMFWPWSNDWLKLSDPIRDLVKAGALIAAEIDRRQRMKK